MGEARAGSELMALVGGVVPMLARAPRGDGHRVLVLPGFGGGDSSTRPLRWFLDRLGYRTHGWGLGRNLGPTQRLSSALHELVDTMHREHGRVSLIGWSLGGVYATELAARAPHRVRSLITLGSPLAGRHRRPVGVPTTSIFSRTDAIVRWPSSTLRDGPLRENVEVRGSHIGLGHNPAVLVVIADRLAQAEGAWQPFVVPRWGERWIDVSRGRARADRADVADVPA